MRTNVYQPLDPGTSAICLLEILPDHSGPIQCRLHTHYLRVAPPFVALSYTWSDPTPTQNIILNDTSFTVRPNLHSALTQLRIQITNGEKPFTANDTPPLLWIDALCINQDDLSERSHQVNMMADIFTSAKLVVVWLNNSQRASNTSPASTFDYAWWKRRDGFPDVKSMQAMSDMGANAYWSRLWVVQEFCLAREIVLMAETRHFGLLVLDMAQSESEMPRIFLSTEPLVRMRFAYQAANRSREASEIPFFETFRDLGIRACSDPRDRVFGLLSLFKGQFDYQADYTKNSEEVFLSVLEYMVASDEGRGLIHVFELEDVEPQLQFLKEALEIPPETRVERRKIYRTVVKLAMD